MRLSLARLTLLLSIVLVSGCETILALLAPPPPEPAHPCESEFTVWDRDAGVCRSRYLCRDFTHLPCDVDAGSPSHQANQADQNTQGTEEEEVAAPVEEPPR